jgi:cysteine desulfurase
MIYLDYSATTPVDDRVLDTYVKVTKEYIGNANSMHTLGVKSKELWIQSTNQIAEILGVDSKEIIFTSGASESNATAIKGVAYKYNKRGKHIITTKLEHKSILETMGFLSNNGYEVDFVELDSNGQIDLKSLESLMREDTILVSICAVNSEVGIRQPLKTLRQIIKKENPNTLFHSDMTQAIGKIPVNMHDVDMASMSGHKIFGPKGIGFLFKNSKVNIVPLIHGSGHFNDLRSGTPPLPLIVALSKACRIALENLEEKEAKVLKFNERICNELAKYDGVILNKTKYSIPHILNISLENIRPETFIHSMEDDEVYLSTNTACSSGELSTSVMAIYNDKKRATSTIRISLSYVTTNEEVSKFLNLFKSKYKELDELMRSKHE